MSRPQAGAARWFELVARTAVPALAVGLVAGAVVAAPRLVGEHPERADRRAAARQAVPVRTALLSCPGPLDADTGDGPGRSAVQVLAASPPQALRPARPRSAAGSIPAAISVLTLAGATPPPTSPPTPSPRPLTGLSEVRGSLVSGASGASGAGGGAVVALGRGWSAAGLIAEQWSVTTSGEQRGLSGSSCLPPQDDGWLVGGGDEEGRRGRLVLSNPHDSATQVSVDVLAAAGTVPRGPGSSVLLAPRSRTEVVLDALAPGAGSPAVRVRSTGASVGAVLHDSWLDGLVPRGGDDVVPAAAPGRRVLVPGVLVPAAGTGRVSLRVAVPGTAQGVAQVRLFGPRGEVRVPGTDVVRVPGGATGEVDLSAAPAGAYGVLVQADVPVVAAIRVERRRGGGPGDFAWAASGAVVDTLAGAAVPDGPAPGRAGPRGGGGGPGTAWRTSVLLTGVPADGADRSTPVVDVVSVLPGGERRTRTVRVPTGSTVRVPVTGRSVWVRPQPGHAPVVAARWTQCDDPSGPLITVSPMRQALLRQVPVDVVPAAD